MVSYWSAAKTLATSAKRKTKMVWKERMVADVELVGGFGGEIKSL